MSARNLKSMEGRTVFPERARNKKRPGSSLTKPPRAPKIKATQHPVHAAVSEKPVEPSVESSETSSDDGFEEDHVEHVTPTTGLSERIPRPEITDPAWTGKTFPLVTIRSPHHGNDKTILYLTRDDKMVGLYPFTRKTKNPKCFVAYVTVDRTDLKQGRKVRIHPGQMCTLLGQPERLFGISSIILIADNPPRQVK